MKILVFAEGTILMHPSEDKINNYAEYVSIKNAVAKIIKWVEQGAEVEYLTSRTKFMEIKAVKDVLKKFNFPGESLNSRHDDETYKDVVEKIKPDVFIEDDCKSIGGEDVTTPKLNKELKIHGIVVPEFGGIDHLPDALDELKDYGKKEEEPESVE